MPMSKEILGPALLSARDSVDQSAYDLTTESGIAQLRLALSKAEAEAIIEHIKTYATFNIPVTTTVVGACPTGAVSGTGTGTATGTGVVT